MRLSEILAPRYDVGAEYLPTSQHNPLGRACSEVSSTRKSQGQTREISAQVIQ